METLVDEFDEFWAEYATWENFRDNNPGYVMYLSRFTYLIDLLIDLPLVDQENLECLREELTFELDDIFSGPAN